MQSISKHIWLNPYILLICLIGGAVTTLTPDASGQAREISQQSFSASGRVTMTLRELDSGRSRVVGVSGVTVKFEMVSGPGRGIPASVKTDSNGHWFQSGFSPGVAYKATPSRDGLSFTPVFVTFSNVNRPITKRTGLNFEAQRQR